MKICAIIAEYNPFHLGHQHQIQMLRQQLGEDCALLILQSAYFCQRGIPALLSPGERAETAIRSGADLVLQVPQLFGLQSAEAYAQHHVNCIQNLPAVHYLAFSTESGNLSELQKIAAILTPEREDYRSLLAAKLATGRPYYLARCEAVAELCNESHLTEFMSQPNQILAISYLQQLRRRPERPLKVLCLKRSGAEEKNNSLQDGYASASAIRQLLLNPEYTPRDLASRLLSQLPSHELALLLSERSRHKLPGDQAFSAAIISQLYSHSAEELSCYLHWDEDLAARLKSLIRERYDFSFSELLQATACLSYPQSRLRRAFYALLLGLKQEDAKLEVPYLQVLAFNKRGRYVLKQLNKNPELPLLSRFSDSQDLKSATRVAEIDRIAASLWSRARRSQSLDLLAAPAQLRF